MKVSWIKKKKIDVNTGLHLNKFVPGDALMNFHRIIEWFWLKET